MNNTNRLQMNRVFWIDVMKGLGILSVVVGHIYIGEISRNIFIFHMPLFFFISGYLFTPKTNHKEYFYKKVIHLLIPYFSFLILLSIFFIDLPSWNIKSFFIYYSKLLIGGRFLGGYFGVFWFITCLFLTQQIMNYLIIKFNPKTTLLLVTFFLFLSYINSYYFPNIWLPWNANVVLAAAPIFHIGYLFKKLNININNNFLLFSGFFIIIFSFYYPNNVYDMKYAKYGIVLITLLSGIILTLNVKILSEKLSNNKLTYKILSEIGKASMVIMYLHQPIQMLIRSKVTKNTSIRFLIASIVSYLIYLAFSKSIFGKAFFLGSKKDLNVILKRTSKPYKNN